MRRNGSAGARPRWLAAQACRAVLDRGQALDEVLASLLDKVENARDRALVRRLANGVMRNWPALDFIVRELLERPMRSGDRVIFFLLTVAVHELRDAREPDHAVVHAAVAAAGDFRGGRLRGLVNAVLRNFQRRREALQKQVARDPVRDLGYPRWLIDHIDQDWPGEREGILAAGNAVPPLWLRVNRRCWTPQQALEALEAAGIQAMAMPDFPDALVLRERVRVSDLPGLAEGRLSVQDGAAQLVVDEMALEDGLRVLDACAAPGGKSAHILERADVDLTALDVSADRLIRVEKTLKRLGLDARLQCGDACRPRDWWDDRRFDRILVDAPCSATGVIRRHPDIRWLRRASDVDALIQTQRAMLNALWPLLAPGGILVYATCSVLVAENAGQFQSFLERHADACLIEHSELPGRPGDPGRQLLPGDQDCDGFFCAAARRLQPE
ncbi:16S rRNA (cytosine(967)-C(5))-methyltransferase RsmB [Wenzhouxiangella sp. AB-CW3]|uniref:16S rRNA (cytosine(967)-C(5))-methyltransferase RsmB n=1 Tax=Wenzhouxiangella sp. AB-CW3 TaxID=2771012 RepID=UPI00168B68E8|nr:16S rRNA (cytosine(967)-C(5))-methyltransferase RsmB [Wenzhouxiangella sp. AB-CW3]QOC22291.1 16S rRNA (cytosine(967)-C(5))-methyltransferase RsmB [Wenzhouxiangella sp. AB-CW3]